MAAGFPDIASLRNVTHAILEELGTHNFFRITESTRKGGQRHPLKLWNSRAVSFRLILPLSPLIPK